MSVRKRKKVVYPTPPSPAPPSPDDIAWVNAMADLEEKHGGFPGSTGGVGRLRKRRKIVDALIAAGLSPDVIGAIDFARDVRFILCRDEMSFVDLDRYLHEFSDDAVSLANEALERGFCHSAALRVLAKVGRKPGPDLMAELEEEIEYLRAWQDYLDRDSDRSPGNPHSMALDAMLRKKKVRAEKKLELLKEALRDEKTT